MAPRKKTSTKVPEPRVRFSGDILDDHRWWWWAGGKGDVWKSLVHVAAIIKDRQKAQHREDWRHARLYAGMRPDLVSAFGALGYVSAASSGPSRLPRFSFNVIESVIETAASRLAANEVRPVYVTDGAQWDGQERAEMLTQFVDGCFHASRFRSVAVECGVDAMVFGTGISKTFLENGQIKSERVFPLELLVDEEDGMHRDPRMLVQHKLKAREVLIAQNEARTDITKDMKSAIERALRKAPAAKVDMVQSSLSDNVSVFEGWHLPSGPDTKDGRHVICIDGADLFDEEWDRPLFPFEILRYRKGLLGFWGRGIAEQLTGIQIEINRVVSFVQQSLSAAAFKVFLEVGSKVIKSHLNREIGGIVEYVGQAPVFAAPNVLNEQVLEWLANLYGKAYELTGVNQMAASGQKPAGLNSGAAIRSYDDLQDGRFARFGKEFEEWHVQNAEQQIDLARRTYKDQKSFAVSVPGADFLRKIDWKDIDLERDEYIAQVFPESALPKTPAARRQTIQEYMQAQLISPEEGRRLLRMPDLKSAQDLDDAPRNLVLFQIGKMLKGEAQVPDPNQNLALARDLVTKAYCHAKLNGTPEDRLALLDEFNQQIDAVMQMNAQQQAENQQPPGPPMAKPTPPPTSDMLPNAPSAPPQAA